MAMKKVCDATGEEMGLLEGVEVTITYASGGRQVWHYKDKAAFQLSARIRDMLAEEQPEDPVAEMIIRSLPHLRVVSAANSKDLSMLNSIRGGRK